MFLSLSLPSSLPKINKHVQYYAAERKKELLPFATVWVELETIVLSEISQAVKDKYHMISPISGT